LGLFFKIFGEIFFLPSGHSDEYIHIIKAAQLILENSAQASFRFSPPNSFRTPRPGWGANPEANSLKSSLLHLTGQPYCKKGRSAKVKDGIMNLILRNYLIDHY
jgi:hypothetical protein